LRINPVSKYPLVPYLGSSHRQLEVQVARINSFAKAEGEIDCLFIGNSMVWLGVNPEIFSETFEKNTGQELDCFNFGIATMPAGAAGIMAGILVDKYKPKILIFGTSPRDYAIPLDAEDSAVITDTPWVQYQSGKYSPQGWLYSHSYLFGHLANFNRLLRFDRTVITDIGTSSYDRFGFLPKTRPILEENIRAGTEDTKKWLANYIVLQENVDGLRQIAEISTKGVEVVFFEAPVKPSNYDYFENRDVDLEKFVSTVQDVADEYEIPFIRMPKIDILPSEGWWNENHLNLEGANAFSVWLAEQIGNDKTIVIPNQ
jgi:hypothetical protein